MKQSLHFILVTELVVLLNMSGVNIPGANNDDKKDPDEKKEAKEKKLIPVDHSRIKIRKVFDWDREYEKTIEFIKKHEGFANGKVYVCAGGYKTIGYGHKLLPGENFTQITEAQADSLLRVDFNKALAALDRNIKLEGSQRLAMAHFVFAKGIGSFNRSTLKKKILNNEPIDDEITKWCYYTNKNGEKVKSDYLLKIRKWELEMYKFNRS